VTLWQSHSASRQARAFLTRYWAGALVPKREQQISAVGFVLAVYATSRMFYLILGSLLAKVVPTASFQRFLFLPFAFYFIYDIALEEWVRE
jgi:hypothetical protein